MSIKIKSLQVYPIFEENCQANQLITSIQAERDDDNTPNFVYELYDTGGVYDYIYIHNSTGNIYLTLEGVNAINEDHDNPDNDIQELNFKVKIIDSNLGDNLVQDVTVAVVRVDDSPPVITEEFIYDLYQNNTTVGHIVYDVRTKSPSYFFIEDSDLVTIKVSDLGRVTLTSAGAEYFSNLDLTIEENKSYTFTINIQDKNNSKSISKQVTIPIKPETSNFHVAKKSILEEIAVVLGSDLAGKITTLDDRLDMIETNNGYLSKILSDISDHQLLSSSFYGDNLIQVLRDGNINSDDIWDTEYNNIKTISNSIHENINKILQDKIDSDLIIFKNINSTFASLTSNINKNITKSGQYYDTELIKNLSDNILDTHDTIEDLINAKINTVLEIVKNVVTDFANHIYNDLNDFQHDYVKWMYTDLGAELWNMNKQLVNHDSRITNHNDELKVNEDNIKTNIDDIWSTDWATLLSKQSSTLDYYQNHNKDTLTLGTKGIIGKIDEINNRTLEDWGIASRGGYWDFNNGDDVSLKFDNNNIIEKNGNDWYFKSYTGNVYLTAQSKQVKFDTDGTLTVDGGNGKVIADTCDCTATHALYSDLAEYYESDEKYEYGTVITIGGDKEITIAPKTLQENKFIGVISDKPGFILNKAKAKDGYLPVVLKGKTPIKIEPKLNIKKGDAIYLSSMIDGYGTNIPHFNDKIIGYSLEDKETTIYDTIMILI